MPRNWRAEELIAFETRVAGAFEEGKIRAPVHLSGGNEEQLIGIFREISPDDFVLCSYRSHYHALLHGCDPDWVFSEILSGRSMSLSSLKPWLYSTAIVGGQLSISVGMAAGLRREEDPRRVWCFCGDMAASIGAFHEATCYAEGHDLPIKFVVEDNGLSCNTPTLETWATKKTLGKIRSYSYERRYPHVGIGKFVRL